MNRNIGRMLGFLLALALLLSMAGVSPAEALSYEEFMKPYDETVRITTARMFATWMTLDPGDDENSRHAATETRGSLATNAKTLTRCSKSSTSTRISSALTTSLIGSQTGSTTSA